MKPIIIDGEQWWYKITTHHIDTGDYYDYLCKQTSFFKSPTITEKKRKYLNLFGPWVTVEVENTKPDFTIKLEITDSKHTKQEIKKAIDEQLAILKRKEEIKNGEII
jgi:hypothetical protein